MTIEIHKPELEALIRARLESGRFDDVEDVLLHALKISPEPPFQPPKPRRHLVDILSEPPFAGSDLEISRQRDDPRPVDL